MRVIAGEQTRSSWRTGCRSNMAIGEGYPFTHQAIQVGGIHIVKSQFANRVETLLIGDDKDNVRSFVCHDMYSRIMRQSLRASGCK